MQFADPSKHVSVDLGKEIYDGVHQLTAYILKNEIEEVKCYDPNTWNDFPEVTPPDCVLMHVEVRYPREEDTYYIPLILDLNFPLVFKLDHWENQRGGRIAMGDNAVIRFRPWED